MHQLRPERERGNCNFKVASYNVLFGVYLTLELTIRLTLVASGGIFLNHLLQGIMSLLNLCYLFAIAERIEASIKCLASK